MTSRKVGKKQLKDKQKVDGTSWKWKVDGEVDAAVVFVVQDSEGSSQMQTNPVSRHVLRSGVPR